MVRRQVIRTLKSVLSAIKTTCSLSVTKRQSATTVVQRSQEMNSAKKYYRNFVGKYYSADVIGNTIYVEKPAHSDDNAIENELRHFATVETHRDENEVEVRETIGNKMAVEFAPEDDE